MTRVNPSLSIPNQPSENPIGRLFYPESVAVVGVSGKGGLANEILKNLGKWGFKGRICAINPRYDQIEGVACHPNLRAVGHTVGLVIIAVASDRVPAVLEDCAAAGVGAVQIISSGFADQGGAGVARQRHLEEWSRRTGIPLAGPNCLGLVNAANGLVAIQTPFPAMKAGGVSAILQSGMLAPSLLMPLLGRGIGLGRVLTTGNEACLDVADLIDYLADDPDTRVIACYCEQIRRPQAFIAACEKAAARDIPIVMLKVGRSDAAQAAALAHTGSLAGADSVIEAVLRRLGVTRVDTIDDLVECTVALSTRRRPKGKRVAFCSFSGGAVGVLSDLAERCGIDFAPLPPALRTELEGIVPEFGSVGNPLDLTGQSAVDTDIIEGALAALARSGAYDAVIWGRDFPAPLDLDGPIGRSIEQAASHNPEMLFGIMGMVGGHYFPTPDPQAAMARPSGQIGDFPFLQGTETGLKALAALMNYAEFQRDRPERPALGLARGPLSPRALRAKEMIGATPGDVLSERAGKKILQLYGIPVAREVLVTSARDAEAAIGDFAGPVAMKIEAEAVLHKTEIGGVVLNVDGRTAAAVAFERIIANTRAALPDAQISGVLMQQMAPKGAEILLGAKIDPRFGPLIAVGLGGIWVEILKDLQFLIAPITPGMARAALDRLKGAALLKGARGATPSDLDGLAQVVSAFAMLCTDLADDLSEIDINPIVMNPEGQGLLAVDCVMVKKQRTETLE